MKRYDFNSFEDFEKSGISGDYEKIAVIHYESGWTDSDVMTECKSWKTAIKRFFKFLTEDIFDGWEATLTESCENGFFSQKDLEAGYAFEVEEVDDGLWYIFLNLKA